ncbi:MAG: rod shape-determining protein MreC [Candidatus Omnitrophica bacterium]|nr:rod shape-determining protein MreC [Candidatus Omnitrophota bacterium]
MKIKKPITFLVLAAYILLIYFSPPAYIDKPKLLFLQIAKFPLQLTNQVFFQLNLLIHSRQLIKENTSLRKTVDILTHQLVEYKEAGLENKRLNRLLEFKTKSHFKLIAARIIGKDPSNLSDTVVIDQGKHQKIKKGTVIISEAGLVGSVYTCSSNVSRVRLITDPNSRISAIISRTRQLGMLYGTSTSLCRLRYLPLDSDIEVGDEIITSGFSDAYPKGILVGKVVKIIKEPRGLSLSALVKPAVDISKAEELLCIE